MGNYYYVSIIVDREDAWGWDENVRYDPAVHTDAESLPLDIWLDRWIWDFYNGSASDWPFSYFEKLKIVHRGTRPQAASFDILFGYFKNFGSFLDFASAFANFPFSKPEAAMLVVANEWGVLGHVPGATFSPTIPLPEQQTHLPDMHNKRLHWLSPDVQVSAVENHFATDIPVDLIVFADGHEELHASKKNPEYDDMEWITLPQWLQRSSTNAGVEDQWQRLRRSDYESIDQNDDYFEEQPSFAITGLTPEQAKQTINATIGYVYQTTHMCPRYYAMDRFVILAKQGSGRWITFRPDYKDWESLEFYSPTGTSRDSYMGSDQHGAPICHIDIGLSD